MAKKKILLLSDDLQEDQELAYILLAQSAYLYLNFPLAQLSRS